VAARSTVGNLVAGLQIAFAEPIRLGDAVVVQGEWGHVEETTLTDVVVRIWDRRRLVLPSSYFLENPIENWTRYSTDILSGVFLYVDYTTRVDGVRTEFERIVRASALWDGNVAVLQVVDAPSGRCCSARWSARAAARPATPALRGPRPRRHRAMTEQAGRSIRCAPGSDAPKSPGGVIGRVGILRHSHDAIMVGRFPLATCSWAEDRMLSWGAHGDHQPRCLAKDAGPLGPPGRSS
jgi:hypothetical protein